MLRIAMHSAQCIMRSAGTSAVAKVEGVAGEATSASPMEPPLHRAEARKELPPKRYARRRVTTETSTHRNRVAVSIRAPWGALIRRRTSRRHLPRRRGRLT